MRVCVERASSKGWRVARSSYCCAIIRYKTLRELTLLHPHCRYAYLSEFLTHISALGIGRACGFCCFILLFFIHSVSVVKSFIALTKEIDYGIMSPQRQV